MFLKKLAFMALICSVHFAEASQVYPLVVGGAPLQLSDGSIVTCSNLVPPPPVVVVPAPSFYKCRVRYNGGPVQGVEGIQSFDKCAAKRSALQNCIIHINNANLIDFACKHGGGAFIDDNCKDSNGNLVNTNDCSDF